MKAVAVFCGSNSGTNPVYTEAARAAGEIIAKRGMVLVYGGGHRGLMGVTADAALATGGEVHGVITRYLQDRELQHKTITRCEVVETMAERKQRFAELCDSFLILAGGIGTLEETSDMWSRAQLGGLKKPIGIINTNGFYDPLLAQVQRMIDDGFLPEAQREWLVTGTEIGQVLDGLARYAPSEVSKWI
jgi:uncharacterized protein (TIGR00730 family)